MTRFINNNNNSNTSNNNTKKSVICSEVVIRRMKEIMSNLKEIMDLMNIKYSRSTERVYIEMKKARKPMKSAEIALMSRLTDRTVRTALNKLYRADLVKKVPNFTDMRSHYHVAL